MSAKKASSKADNSQQGNSKQDDTSPWEWVAALIGGALVVSIVCFLVVEAVREGSTPPRIQIEVVDVSSRGAGYLVEILVVNRGEATAAQLVVEGELQRDGKAVETSTITLTFAPAGSSRKAGLIFERDPSEHDLQIRARGYEAP
jgi:uncharacterized protein (TIGR02588 family)